MKKKNNYFIIILIIVFNLLIFNITVNSMENKTFYDFELDLITGKQLV